MIFNLLWSTELLADACTNFRRFAVEGVEANREQIDQYVRTSLMVVTALAPHIGYDKAAEIAKHAHHEGTDLKTAAVALGHLSAEDFDQWVRPEDMTEPG